MKYIHINLQKKGNDEKRLFTAFLVRSIIYKHLRQGNQVWWFKRMVVKDKLGENLENQVFLLVNMLNDTLN